MGFELTPQSLKKLCRELKLYSSCPELNDVLYLHQKGIVKLKHLDAYTGLKSLHLECNAISTIEGLDALIQLRCLFLNQNLVEYVQGLESLGQLETIDLADNQIKEIKGLACCTKLRQLNLSGNRIRSEEDVSHLLECKSLVSLDIGKNRIDSEDALKVVRRLPLNLLRLSGNPIVSTTKHYRKATLTSMSKLQYLDESPVFEKERRLAQAWLEGGPQAEQDMREKIKQEEAAEREAHRRAFDEMVGKAKAESALSNEAKARMDVTNVTKENRERADETPSILVDENPDHAGNMDSGCNKKYFYEE